MSPLSETQDLRVASVTITLEVLATKSAGTEISLRVPFIGTEFGVGGEVTKRDTQKIDMTLVPSAPKPHGVRGLPVDRALVDAIATVRDTMASAATGPHPWALSESTVSIAFGVTREGTISVGVAGERSTDVVSDVDT